MSGDIIDHINNEEESRLYQAAVTRVRAFLKAYNGDVVANIVTKTTQGQSNIPLSTSDLRVVLRTWTQETDLFTPDEVREMLTQSVEADKPLACRLCRDYLTLCDRNKELQKALGRALDLAGAPRNA